MLQTKLLEFLQTLCNYLWYDLIKYLLSVDQCFSFFNLVFIQARTKKSMKLDPDVKNISKEALVSVTKTTELFLGYLAKHTLAQYYSTNPKKQHNGGGCSLKDTDLRKTIHSKQLLKFLRLDFPSVSSSSRKRNSMVCMRMRTYVYRDAYVVMMHCYTSIIVIC